MENQQLESQGETIYSREELRTSYNNMLCTVVYEPLPKEQQEEVENILAVAN